MLAGCQYDWHGANSTGGGSGSGKDVRYILLRCHYVTTSEALSASEMQAVINPYQYILFRFPVVNILLPDCLV